MEHIKKLLQRIHKKWERKARKGVEKNRQGDTGWKNEVRKKMEPSNISEILLSAQTKLQTNTESDPKGRIIIAIGEAGSGKTFQIVLPNMFDFHSLIVTDYYGELQKDTEKSLKEAGCQVRKFSFNDRENSYRYNPFCFINTKKDVEELASGILNNLYILGVDEIKDEKVRAAGQAFLCMMIAYTIECTNLEMQTFAKMFEAVCMVRENMETLERLPKVRFPRNSTIWYDSFLKEFQSFSEDEKHMACECVHTCLMRFLSEPIKELTAENTIDFQMFQKGKTVLFLPFAFFEPEFRVLLGIFCAQALKYFAEEEKKTEIPVMFVLDDFWQLGEIPGIVEKVTVAKERGVSCLLTMHTVEDCKRQTKDPGKELLALADAVVYTGSSEPDTREFFSNWIKSQENDECVRNEEMIRNFGREECIIFITENDVMKADLPIYHIDRVVKETGKLFKDEAHIIYVNSQIKDETKLGRLMYDFSCTNAKDMHNKVLADRVRYFKGR